MLRAMLGPPNAQTDGPRFQNTEYRQYTSKTMDPTLPILSYGGILGHCFGHFGGLGRAT